MRYRLDPFSPSGISPVGGERIIVQKGSGAVHTGAKSLNDLSDVDVSGGATDNQALAYDSATNKWIPQTISGGGGGSGDVYNYSSLLAPQLFNPDASGVSGGTDDFTLSSTNAVAFVTLNGQVLDDSEYSLASSTLTVTPDVGFTDTSDEVLVFQQSFTYSSTGGSIFSFVQKSSAYTVTVDDYYIEATANTFTLTLPTAVSIGGQTFVIKNSGTGIITIDGNGSETIDGSTTIQLTQYESVSLASNGSNWIIT